MSCAISMRYQTTFLLHCQYRPFARNNVSASPGSLVNTQRVYQYGTVTALDNFRFRSQDNLLAIFNVLWINFSSALFIKVECRGEARRYSAMNKSDYLRVFYSRINHTNSPHLKYWRCVNVVCVFRGLCEPSSVYFVA